MDYRHENGFLATVEGGNRVQFYRETQGKSTLLFDGTLPDSQTAESVVIVRSEVTIQGQSEWRVDGFIRSANTVYRVHLGKQKSHNGQLDGIQISKAELERSFDQVISGIHRRLIEIVTVSTPGGGQALLAISKTGVFLYLSDAESGTDFYQKTRILYQPPQTHIRSRVTTVTLWEQEGLGTLLKLERERQETIDFYRVLGLGIAKTEAPLETGLTDLLMSIPIHSN